MKIAIFNWRDPKNPASGGAEILTLEIAKGFVKRGDTVLWFASVFKGCKKKEILEGIEIIRKGKPDLRAFKNSVHYKAFNYYSNHLKGNVDLVIDEIHGLPFFTPLYVKEKKIALICE